jgi:hypothetical protein
MACCEQGWETRFFAKNGTGTVDFSSSYQQYAVISSTVGKRETLSQVMGIRGTRQRYAIDNYLLRQDVSGTITMPVSPHYLDHWLPRILGAAKSGNDIAQAETLPAFGWVQSHTWDLLRYNDCYVSRAVIRGSSGNMVEMSVDIVGKTEDTALSSVTSETWAYTEQYEFYRFHEGVLNVGGSAYSMDSFELTIDNQLDVQFYNSLTANCMAARDREVRLRADVCTSVSLYTGGQTQVDGSLTFTNGNCSSAFTFGKLIWPQDTPAITGKNNIMMTLDMIALHDGTGAEVLVTNDSTP